MSNLLNSLLAGASGGGGGTGLTFEIVTTTTKVMGVNYEYVANNSSLVSLELPTIADAGDKIIIRGWGAGGWKLLQNASQYIKAGNSTTTVGAGGYIQSVDQYDVIELTCIITNNGWNAIFQQGTMTII